jgi:hypothetical protein
MRRFLVHAANSALLVILLIGIPAIVSARFGRFRLSSDPQLHRLMMGGLGLVAAGNMAGALLLRKDRKGWRACVAWALLFGLTLAAEFSYARGYIDFAWLKTFLHWVQEHL